MMTGVHTILSTTCRQLNHEVNLTCQNRISAKTSDKLISNPAVGFAQVCEIAKISFPQVIEGKAYATSIRDV